MRRTNCSAIEALLFVGVNTISAAIHEIARRLDCSKADLLDSLMIWPQLLGEAGA